MPLPASVANISDIAVLGAPIDEAAFPRNRDRRLNARLTGPDMDAFEKAAESTADYAVDLSTVIDPKDAVIAAYAWTSDPTGLQVTACRFADKGVAAWVKGGTDEAEYTLTLQAKTFMGRSLQFFCTITVIGEEADALPATVPNTALPKDSYLADVLGAVLEPAYADALGNSLSEPA